MVELRTRPASFVPPSPSSLRHGLRNSTSQTSETLIELAPHRRPRHSKTQADHAIHLDACVHVSSVSPVLVISNIKHHQWPEHLQIPDQEPPSKRVKRYVEEGSAISQSPAQTRRLSRVSNESKSPPKLWDASAEATQPGVVTRAGRHASKKGLDSSEGYETVGKERRRLPKGWVFAEDVEPSPKPPSPVPILPADLTRRRRSSKRPNSEEQRAHIDASVASVKASPDDENHSAPRLNRTSTARSFGAPSKRTSVAPSNVASPPAQSPPKSVDIHPSTEIEHLTEADLPSPFLERPPTPQHFADKAAKLHHERYLPLPPLSSFTNALTSHPPSSRKTSTLFKLANSTFETLRIWQDEYLKLDERTGPAQNPPRRPATGGRLPVDPEMFEAQKEINLWGHVLGIEGREYSRSLIQRPGYAGLGLGNGRPAAAVPQAEADGRRARRRGADAKLIDGVIPNASDQESPEKRTRKPVRRFDVGINGASGRKRRRRAELDEAESGPRAEEAEDLASDEERFEDERERAAKRGRVGRLHDVPSSRLNQVSTRSSREPSRHPSATPAPAIRGRRMRGKRGRARGRGGRLLEGMGRVTSENTQAGEGVDEEQIGKEQSNTQTDEPSKVVPLQPAAEKEVPPQTAYKPYYAPPLVPGVAQASAQPSDSTSHTTPSEALTPNSPAFQPTVDEGHPVEAALSSRSPASQDAPEYGANGRHLSKAPKMKSEKRSSSMTAWWAERKRKMAEEKMRLMHEQGLPFVDGTAGFAASPASGAAMSKHHPARSRHAFENGPPPVIVPAGHAPPPSDGKGVWIPVHQYGPPAPAPAPPPPIAPQHHQPPIEKMPPPQQPAATGPPPSQPRPTTSERRSRKRSGPQRNHSQYRASTHFPPPPPHDPRHQNQQQPPHHPQSQHGRETPPTGRWSFVWAPEKQSYRPPTLQPHPPPSPPPVPPRHHRHAPTPAQEHHHHHQNQFQHQAAPPVPPPPPVATEPTAPRRPLSGSQYPDGTYREFPTQLPPPEPTPRPPPPPPEASMRMPVDYAPWKQPSMQPRFEGTEPPSRASVLARAPPVRPPSQPSYAARPPSSADQRPPPRPPVTIEDRYYINPSAPPQTTLPPYPSSIQAQTHPPPPHVHPATSQPGAPLHPSAPSQQYAPHTTYGPSSSTHHHRTAWERTRGPSQPTYSMHDIDRSWTEREWRKTSREQGPTFYATSHNGFGILNGMRGR
ncbi:MAG: hypothetical protein Q9159_003070 [Coniocarpon cinnabarinum]